MPVDDEDFLDEDDGEDDDDDPCPDCGAPLRVKWSGVECSSCDYWFCV